MGEGSVNSSNYRFYQCLVDNRNPTKRRIVNTMSRTIPSGWIQHHTWWMGDNIEIHAYVWGEEIPEFPLEDFINYNVLFRRGDYEVQD